MQMDARQQSFLNSKCPARPMRTRNSQNHNSPAALATNEDPHFDRGGASVGHSYITTNMYGGQQSSSDFPCGGQDQREKKTERKRKRNRIRKKKVFKRHQESSLKNLEKRYVRAMLKRIQRKMSSMKWAIFYQIFLELKYRKVPCKVEKINNLLPDRKSFNNKVRGLLCESLSHMVLIISFFGGNLDFKALVKDEQFKSELRTKDNYGQRKLSQDWGKLCDKLQRIFLGSTQKALQQLYMSKKREHCQKELEDFTELCQQKGLFGRHSPSPKLNLEPHTFGNDSELQLPIYSANEQTRQIRFTDY